MTQPPRVAAADARERARRGALVIDAYEDEAKSRRTMLDGAMSLAELRAVASTLPKDQELLFYCA